MFVGFELLRSDASELLTVFPSFEIMLKLHQSVIAYRSENHALDAYAGLDVVVCAS